MFGGPPNNKNLRQANYDDAYNYPMSDVRYWRNILDLYSGESDAVSKTFLTTIQANDDLIQDFYPSMSLHDAALSEGAPFELAADRLIWRRRYRQQRLMANAAPKTAAPNMESTDVMCSAFLTAKSIRITLPANWAMLPNAEVVWNESVNAVNDSIQQTRTYMVLEAIVRAATNNTLMRMNPGRPKMPLDFDRQMTHWNNSAFPTLKGGAGCLSWASDLVQTILDNHSCDRKDISIVVGPSAIKEQLYNPSSRLAVVLNNQDYNTGFPKRVIEISTTKDGNTLIIPSGTFIEEYGNRITPLRKRTIVREFFINCEKPGMSGLGERYRSDIRTFEIPDYQAKRHSAKSLLDLLSTSSVFDLQAIENVQNDPTDNNLAIKANYPGEVGKSILTDIIMFAKCLSSDHLSEDDKYLRMHKIAKDFKNMSVDFTMYDLSFLNLYEAYKAGGKLDQLYNQINQKAAAADQFLSFLFNQVKRFATDFGLPAGFSGAISYDKFLSDEINPMPAVLPSILTTKSGGTADISDFSVYATEFKLQIMEGQILNTAALTNLDNFINGTEFKDRIQAVGTKHKVTGQISQWRDYFNKSDKFISPYKSPDHIDALLKKVPISWEVLTGIIRQNFYFPFNFYIHRSTEIVVEGAVACARGFDTGVTIIKDHSCYFQRDLELNELPFQANYSACVAIKKPENTAINPNMFPCGIVRGGGVKPFIAGIDGQPLKNNDLHRITKDLFVYMIGGRENSDTIGVNYSDIRGEFDPELLVPSLRPSFSTADIYSKLFGFDSYIQGQHQWHNSEHFSPTDTQHTIASQGEEKWSSDDNGRNFTIHVDGCSIFGARITDSVFKIVSGTPNFNGTFISANGTIVSQNM